MRISTLPTGEPIYCLRASPLRRAKSGGADYVSLEWQTDASLPAVRTAAGIGQGAAGLRPDRVSVKKIVRYTDRYIDIHLHMKLESFSKRFNSFSRYSIPS